MINNEEKVFHSGLDNNLSKTNFSVTRKIKKPTNEIDSLKLDCMTISLSFDSKEMNKVEALGYVRKNLPKELSYFDGSIRKKMTFNIIQAPENIELIDSKFESNRLKTMNSIFSSLPYCVSRSVVRIRENEKRFQKISELDCFPIIYPSHDLSSTLERKGTYVCGSPSGDVRWRLNDTFWRFFSFNKNKATEGVCKPEKWEDNLKKLEASSVGTQSEISCRSFPKNCDTLIVCGYNNALENVNNVNSKEEAEKAVERLLEMNSYVRVCGNRNYSINCLGAFSIDKKILPLPLKALKSALLSNNVSGFKFCELRCLFDSSIIKKQNNNWVHSAKIDAPKLIEKGKYHDNKQDNIATSLIKFESPEKCENFYITTTYANINNVKLINFPDNYGIKYWLDFISIQSIESDEHMMNEVNHFKIDTEKTKKWYDPTKSVCWCPFLYQSDLGHLNTLIYETQEFSQGFDIKTKGLRLIRINKTPLIALIPVESKTMIASLLKISEVSSLEVKLARLPKYIIKRVHQNTEKAYFVRTAFILLPTKKFNGLVISPIIFSSCRNFFEGKWLSEDNI